MTISAKVVTLSAKDVKEAGLTSFRLSDLEAALSLAGYELCVEK